MMKSYKFKKIKKIIKIYESVKKTVFVNSVSRPHDKCKLNCILPI